VTDTRSVCSRCGEPYFFHAPIPTVNPRQMGDNQNAPAHRGPATPIATQISQTRVLPQWTPPSAPAAGNTNDRRRAGFPLGVTVPPFMSFPTLPAQSSAAGRVSDTRRSVTRIGVTSTRLRRNQKHSFQYIIIIHAEPVQLLQLIHFVTPALTPLYNLDVWICRHHEWHRFFEPPNSKCSKNGIIRSSMPSPWTVL